MVISGFCAMALTLPVGCQAYDHDAVADLESLKERCDLLAEELADVALDLLREAVEGDEEAGRTEKRVTRARHAVEKAAGLLTTGDRSERLA